MRQSKTLKKQQEKRIIGKSETTTIIIYYILFYTEKFIFCQKTNLEKLSLICYVCITVFSCERLFEMQQQNINTHTGVHWSCRRRILSQNNQQQNRYFHVDFDNNGLLSPFLIFQRGTLNLEETKEFLKEAIWFTRYN